MIFWGGSTQIASLIRAAAAGMRRIPIGTHFQYATCMDFPVTGNHDYSRTQKNSLQTNPRKVCIFHPDITMPKQNRPDAARLLLGK
jgi:hypothetical protein